MSRSFLPPSGPSRTDLGSRRSSPARALVVASTIALCSILACSSDSSPLFSGAAGSANSCKLNSDCKLGSVCKSGVCQAGCERTDDCPGGQRCESGACVVGTGGQGGGPGDGGSGTAGTGGGSSGTGGVAGNGGQLQTGGSGGVPPAGGSGGVPPAGGSGGVPPAGGSGGQPQTGGSSGGPGTGGYGGFPPDSGGCMVGQDTTVADLAKGVVGPGMAVHFQAVAMTSQILVYASKSKGSCLWGVFVKDPTQPLGTMLASYGDDMEALPDGGIGSCNPNPLFAGILPGAVLDVTGKNSPYAPAACDADGGAAIAKQSEVLMDYKQTACLTQTGTVPSPVPLKVTDLDGLATGNFNYQGMLVELNNVDALDGPDGGPVGAYGIIKIQGINTVLEIHDNFYFKAQGAPQFPGFTHFTKIVGISHLDYCTWAIQPLDKCSNFVPKSSDCP